MIGTRGLPSPNGCYETAVEEVGRRLVDRGHAVTVYCRSPGNAGQPSVSELSGMRLIQLPTLSVRTIGMNARAGPTPDAAFIFNPGSAPLVQRLRLRGIPTIVHVDAIKEIPDGTKGPANRGYRHWNEQAVVRHADALIADSQRTVDYYRARYAVPTELIRLGARVLHDPPSDHLARLGLEPNGYHLIVTSPVGNPASDVIFDGYRHSSAGLPLAVVGALPRSGGRRRRISALADDPRVRLLGELTDQEQLDQVFAHSLSYLHGAPFGGTDTALMRAMGARTAAIALETQANRDVLGVYGAYFSDPAALATLIEDAELHLHHTQEISEGLQRRATVLFNWGHITDRYEDLAQLLVAARDAHSRSTGHDDFPVRSGQDRHRRGPAAIGDSPGITAASAAASPDVPPVR